MNRNQRQKKIKIKSKKAVTKRFSITSTGLIKHAAQGRRHCLSNKNRKRKRRLGKTKYLFNCDISLIKRKLKLYKN